MTEPITYGIPSDCVHFFGFALKQVETIIRSGKATTPASERENTPMTFQSV